MAIIRDRIQKQIEVVSLGMYDNQKGNPFDNQKGKENQNQKGKDNENQNQNLKGNQVDLCIPGDTNGEISKWKVL